MVNLSIVFCMFTRGYRMMWDKSSPGDSLLPGEIPEGKPGQKYGFDRPKWRFHGISPNFDWSCRWGMLQDHNLTEDHALVGGLEHFFIFPYLGNVIIPTDFHSIIFQRGKYTTNQPYFVAILLTRPVSWVRDQKIGETKKNCHCKLSMMSLHDDSSVIGKGKRLENDLILRLCFSGEAKFITPPDEFGEIRGSWWIGFFEWSMGIPQKRSTFDG